MPSGPQAEVAPSKVRVYPSLQAKVILLPKWTPSEYVIFPFSKIKSGQVTSEIKHMKYVIFFYFIGLDMRYKEMT